MIQGGMAWVSDANLAAAVSNGGALGLIAAGSMNGENSCRQESESAERLRISRSAVNIMLMNPCAEELAKVVIEEKNSRCDDRRRFAGQVRSRMEGSRNPRDSGRRIDGTCQT
jgi:NAD(P)H-dependent flavin oxidoreductase YrpB (nitropropane dioxygenase family)